MPAAVLVTAPDPELPAILRKVARRATFTTADSVRAVLGVKPGPIVIILDESQADLVAGLRRTDVRAVVLVTPGSVPVIFRRPIIAVVERPLEHSTVLAGLEQALLDLGPRGA